VVWSQDISANEFEMSADYVSYAILYSTVVMFLSAIKSG